MTSSDQRDSWVTALGCAVAAVALGQALQEGNGILQTDAIKWLTVTGVATLVAVASPAFASIERTGSRAVELILAAGLAYQFFQLFTTPPGLYVQPDRAGGMGVFSMGLAAAAALAGMSLLDPRRLGQWTFPALLLVFVFLGRWILIASPDPGIDTYVFQRDAGNALLEGTSPYSLRYPDIYGSSPFYGEGLSVGGVLQFGYPYPPLSLLLTVPAQVLLGDYRYAQLIAMALSAACIAYSSPGRVAMSAALLLIFTPRVFLVLEQGWTDPLVVLGFAASTYCALRWRAGLPWVLGLALAVKQYTIFMVPAAWHLIPRPLTRSGPFVLKSLGVAAAITVPFLLWDPGNFWHSVVMLQVFQPFRADSLSYLAWIAQSGAHWPTSLGFFAAACGLGLGLWRQPRTSAGFAATCALTYLGFFAFNKQAFANYYFFALGVLLVTVAAVAAREECSRAS